jgi:cytidylate kinase
MASALTPTILTVSGLIGSGKTSVCRELSALTGWKVVSAGTILRRMAEERGLSVIELNEIAKTDDSIDKLIDDQLIGLRGSAEPLIVDSRLAWHFIPNSYKIHLVVDTAIAGDRVFRAQRSDESYATPADAYAANAQRQTIENERFKQYYGIDCEDWRNYDLILDSSTLWPDALAQKMHQAVTGPAPKGSCWLSPGRLKAGVDVLEDGELGIAVEGGEIVVVSGAALLAATVGEALVAGRLVSYEGAPA